MAIWTSIHGRNGLSKIRELHDEDYLQILNSIPLDELKILRRKMESIRDQHPVADHQLEQHNIYTEKLINAYESIIAGEKSSWKKRAENHYRNDVCYFSEWDGFGFSIDDDIITLSGPMSIFGSTPYFQKSFPETSREYYHSYFKSIMTAFKSDFILYAPEWYGICDGDSETKNVSDLLALEDWRKVSSKTIHSMDYVYIEDLWAD